MVSMIEIFNFHNFSKQTCNNCHHKVEANKLTEAEHSFLLNHVSPAEHI